MSDRLHCWNCGESLTGVPLPISRHAYCDKCSEALHCCRLCLYYDPDKIDQCEEDRAEHPTNKETANFCEYFKPSANLRELSVQQDNAKSQLQSLFDGDMDTSTENKNSSSSTDTESRLNSLFDD